MRRKWGSYAHLGRYPAGGGGGGPTGSHGSSSGHSNSGSNGRITPTVSKTPPLKQKLDMKEYQQVRDQRLAETHPFTVDPKYSPLMPPMPPDLPDAVGMTVPLNINGIDGLNVSYNIGLSLKTLDTRQWLTFGVSAGTPNISAGLGLFASYNTGTGNILTNLSTGYSNSISGGYGLFQGGWSGSNYSGFSSDWGNALNFSANTYSIGVQTPGASVTFGIQNYNVPIFYP